jgi:hypothetical protein
MTFIRNRNNFGSKVLLVLLQHSLHLMQQEGLGTACYLLKWLVMIVNHRGERERGQRKNPSSRFPQMFSNGQRG